MTHHPDDIVISGLGVMSAIGADAASLTQALREGRSGVRQFDRHRNGELPQHAAGFIDDLEGNCARYFDVRKARRWDCLTTMTLATALQAIGDAKLSSLDPLRTGLVLGNGWGGLQTTESFFSKAVAGVPQSANPSLFPETVPNAATGHLSIELGIRGPYTTVSQKQISVEGALAFALGLFAKNQVDVVIWGGMEDVSSWGELGHAHAGALASHDQTLLPFDRARSGTLLGEGGAIMVLERRAQALKRGATVYGNIRALTLGGVATRPGSWPRGPQRLQSVTRHLRRWLERRNISESDIGFVSACALGARALDEFEAQVLHAIFADHKPVWALAGASGSFGCLSSLRVASALLAMREKFIPPTVGLQAPVTPPLDHVRGNARTATSRGFFHHTIADGGGYAALVVAAD